MTRRFDESTEDEAASAGGSSPDAASPDQTEGDALPGPGTRWEITEGTAWVSSPTDPAHTYAARPPLQGPVVLTGPAHDLWTAWAEGLDLEEAVALMQARYDGDPEQIRADARSLAQRLLEAGMLRRRDG